MRKEIKHKEDTTKAAPKRTQLRWASDDHN